MKKNVLFVSYFTGVLGNCPAEWADDKIQVLDEEKIVTYVVTGMGSSGNSRNTVKFYKTPSIARDDFDYECRLLDQQPRSTSYTRFITFPLVLIFGRVVKWLTDKVTRNGSCQWSWIISALPVALYLVLTKKIDVIFCTGGPPSAHLVGALVSSFSRADLINEFQDPLNGSEINKSAYKKQATILFERFFIKRSKKTVYVTKKACDRAKSMHADLAEKIIFCYPGARRFTFAQDLEEFAPCIVTPKQIELLHMGTLYGTRNLDVFFEALDELYFEGAVNKGDLKIVNLGSVYCDKKDKYLKRDDFSSIGEMSRIDAITRAEMSDVLLIVQHGDSRSEETIPYKVYDYLNIELPIFGLVKNLELELLLQGAAHNSLIADPADKKSIKRKIIELVKMEMDFGSKRLVSGAMPAPTLRINNQFLSILE